MVERPHLQVNMQAQFKIRFVLAFLAQVPTRHCKLQRRCGSQGKGLKERKYIEAPSLLQRHRKNDDRLVQ
jgi:hypothetical protein